ncbi:MAG: nucleotidyltransferase domain-containing protein [Nitrospirae bacterium]|nr:MAG: nucleotidyltransferase domain-containing protein [Nitrospirota bacterium]
MPQMSFKKAIDNLLKDICNACKEFYSDRLVSLVVFGSVARGVSVPGSDIDILIVVEKLPGGRLKRVFEFQKNIENKLEVHLNNLKKKGIHINISPVFKTPAEVEMGSPLFLDMTIDSLILFDRKRFMKNYLKKLKEKLETLGSVRVQKGNAWYWVLKPDYKYGDIIEL